MIRKLKKYQFLFEELVKRDFKKKYKRTVLGVLWSVLSPLLMLLVFSFMNHNTFPVQQQGACLWPRNPERSLHHQEGGFG